MSGGGGGFSAWAPSGPAATPVASPTAPTPVDPAIASSRQSAAAAAQAATGLGSGTQSTGGAVDSNGRKTLLGV